MKPIHCCLVALPLIVPQLSPAATLHVSASAGDSAAVVATCLAGTPPYGDLRGCSNDSGVVDASGSAPALTSAAHAAYITGFDPQARSAASLGTLRAFASSSIPSSDGIGHNLQSHAYANMYDVLDASSSFGALYNNYKYTVNITGTATPSSPYGAVPSFTADSHVQLNIRVAATGEVLVQKCWETGATELGNGSISGTVGGVAAGTLLSLELLMQTDTQLSTNSTGQSAFAQADYASTVHFYLEALTPSANTVGASGYNYASPVPEAPIWMLMLAGGGVAALRNRRQRTAAA